MVFSRSTCFSLHAICLCLDLSFPCVVWLDMHVSMLIHILVVLIYMFMLYAMFSHALFIFLLYVDIRVTRSHACMMLLAMPCSNLCVLPILPCYRFRSLSSHAYMLGFTFFCVYVLGSTCSHACFYSHMSRSMFSYVCVLWSMVSTCFMPSSTCLCAPFHVCMPRPRLCLSCHVLL